MEGGRTLCTPTRGGGARAGLVAPDATTFEYWKGRPATPKGGAWEMALSYWKTFSTDDDAQFDREIVLDAAAIAPTVTWGTSPEDVVPVTGHVPAPESFDTPDKRASAVRALEYMGLEAGQRIT